MEVALDEDESAAVQRALESYLSDLRMEIVDTDNPGLKRTLRDERATLERAVAKLGRAGGPTEPTIDGTWSVRIWWRSSTLGLDG